MILFQDFLEDIRDRIKAEPESSFDGAPLSKEQLLADEDKMNTLWARYQKDITEYDSTPYDAYASAVKEVTGITVAPDPDHRCVRFGLTRSWRGDAIKKERRNLPLPLMPKPAPSPQ